MSKKMFFGGGRSPLVDGWDMFTITSDGITPKVYRNGVELALASEITNGTYVKMQLGSAALRVSNKNIDEFMFWRKQLSQNNINDLYDIGYGKFYDNFSLEQKELLTSYLKFENNFIDSVDNLVNAINYLGGYVQGKNGNSFTIGGNAVLTLGTKSASALSICNINGDTPFSMNFHYKTIAGFSFGKVAAYNQSPEYAFTLNAKQFILTLYSLANINNYKRFTFNL